MRQFSTQKYFKLNNSTLKKVGFVSIGVCLTVYVKNFCQRFSTVFADDRGRPQHKPTRVIKSDTDNSGLKLTLYQYQTCPFCCKARAFLDFYGFSYNVVEVNSVWRRETKWSKYKKVPILVADGIGDDGYLQINDSSVIMSMLESYLEDRSEGLDKLHTYYPALESKNHKGKTVLEYPNKYFIMYKEKQNLKTTPAERNAFEIDERKWRRWTDDLFVHVISPNIYRSFPEAIASFNYFSDVGNWENVFSAPERYVVIYVGAVAMYFVGKMLRRKYELKEDVRESLYDACNEWLKALGKKQFMGGEKPNLADISFYGAMNSFEGCQAFREMCRNTKIEPWYKRTQKAVQTHVGSYTFNK